MRASLLAVGGDRRGGDFAAVRLQDTAWVHNDVESALRVGSSGALQIEDLLLLESAAHDTAPRPFLVIGRAATGHLSGVRGSVAALQPLVAVHPSFEGRPVLPFTPDGLTVRDGVHQPPAWLDLRDGPLDAAGSWDVEALTRRARKASPVDRGAPTRP